MSHASRPAEVALPLAALAALRRDIVAEVGEDRAAHMLEEAGRSAGDALVPLIEAALRTSSASNETDSVAAAPASAFWSSLSEVLAARGWGNLAFEPTHPGMGALDATDLAESDMAGAVLRPSCHFTSGMLANVLGHVADEAIAVLEVECRARGDLRCRFLFGGVPALEALHAGLAAGKPLEATLESLA